MRILFKNLLFNKFIMSRRTAPTAGRQQSQQRAPQPSIRSSQAFAPQTPQNLNQHQQMNAKKQLQQQQLQQHAQQQQQLQQQMKGYHQEYQEEYNEKEHVGNITKMTVAQAITLITLRLGSIEQKLMNNDMCNPTVDNESLSNISNRLDVLDSKMNLSSSTDYKQQIDHLTQAVIQSKNISSTLVKENKELKTQMGILKKELVDIKESIENVKNMALGNENKIFQLLNSSIDFQVDEENNTLFNAESELNLSDSEHGIIETDIKETFFENDELRMENIETETENETEIA